MLRQCFFYSISMACLPYCKTCSTSQLLFNVSIHFQINPDTQHINSNYSSYLLYSTVALHTCKHMIKNILFSTIIFYQFSMGFLYVTNGAFLPHQCPRCSSFLELKAVRHLKTLPTEAAEHLDSYMGTNLLEAAKQRSCLSSLDLCK